MTDRGKESLSRSQMQAKPRIEDVIPDYLGGEKRQAALDFVQFLRANKMSPSWVSANTWKAGYRGKGICGVGIRTPEGGNNRGYYGRPGGEPSFVIFPALPHMDEYKAQIMEEGLQDIIWNNAFYCVCSAKNRSLGKGCNPNKPCAGGKTITVLGREIENICLGHLVIWVFDPDAAAALGIKRLLELEQKARAEHSGKQ